MNELDKLRPEVAAAIRTMSGEAGGNRDDAYDVIEAELVRLARENETLTAKCAVLMSLRKRHRANAERAEAELAALKQRADGYVVTLANKSHPSGLCYVMAYTDRETANVLLKNDRHNKGLAVRAFRLLLDEE